MTTNSDAVEAALHDLEGSDFAAIRNHAATLRTALSQPDTSEGVEPVAWEFEWETLTPHGHSWVPALEYEHPKDDKAYSDRLHCIRNIRPLFASPPAPDTTHNAELVEELEGRVQEYMKLGFTSDAGSVREYACRVANLLVDNPSLLTALRTPDSDLSQNGQADTLTQGGEA